jgi:serine/threonine-protein kinase
MVIGKRFELSRPLGGSKMSAAWLAYDLTRKTQVVMKFSHPSYVSHLRYEAYAMRQIDRIKDGYYCHFPAFFTQGRYSNTEYIVMQAINGANLRQTSESRRTTLPEALERAMCLLSGLMLQERIGVVHRDLKPENVMLDQEGNVYIIDYGLACQTDFAEPTGVPVGTFEYMAPEQTRAENVDKRADIYAVGLMLYEDAADYNPMSANTPVDILNNQRSKELPELSPEFIQGRYEPLPELRPKIEKLTRLFNALMQNMGAKDPGRRASDLDQLILQLNQVLSIARDLSLYEVF